MTRFFYPACRAHHAYCMALDFGMKFEKRNGFWTPDGLLAITGGGGYRISVARESESLLEPQAGDTAQHPMNGNCHVLTGSSCFDWFHSSGMKIIQRNGIPFHWPESAD